MIIRLKHLCLSTPFFWSIVALKLVMLGSFSSEYVTRLFIPFIQSAMTTPLNPWDAYLSTGQLDAFPYHPLMLWIFKLAYWPIYTFQITSPYWTAFWFKLPHFIADFAIYFSVYRLTGSKPKLVRLYYYASPIILYAGFIHSQLDLIPTAFLLWCLVFLFDRRPLLAGLLFGAAMCTKLHLAVALPLLGIYLLKTQPIRSLLSFLVSSLGLYSLITIPYLSSGFISMVLANPRQQQLYDVALKIGTTKLVIPALVVLVFYMRFVSYKKVNQDLLIGFLGIAFASLVFLVPPSPGWYVWLVPFMTILFIKSHQHKHIIFHLAWGLNAAYLVYFIGFHPSEYANILFLGSPVDFGISTPTRQMLAFTLLEAMILGGIVFLYRFSLKSNAVYKRESALVLGIGGTSASGKTTLLSDLKALFGDNLLDIEADGAHKWERGDTNWQRFTHYDPKANELHGFSRTIETLKRGQVADVPVYNHATGTLETHHQVSSKPFMIICGLHPFYLPRMRRAIDLKLYMDTDEALSTKWKIARDSTKRGKTAEGVKNEIVRRQDDFLKYIHSQQQYADMVIRYYLTDTDEIALKLTLPADIHLDPIVEALSLDWDYADTLDSQFVIVRQAPDSSVLHDLLGTHIPNLDELVATPPVIATGLRGVVQFFVLVILSHQMRDEL